MKHLIKLAFLLAFIMPFASVSATTHDDSTMHVIENSSSDHFANEIELPDSDDHDKSHDDTAKDEADEHKDDSSSDKDDSMDDKDDSTGDKDDAMDDKNDSIENKNDSRDD